MTRFFYSFCFVCAGLLTASAFSGLGLIGLGKSGHMLLGLSSTLVTISLHCLIFGIFTGSGKDTRELVQDLKLNDKESVAATKAFRRVVFPPALYSILLLVITAIVGGALSGNSGRIASLSHLGVAFFTLFYNLKAFWIEAKAVKENSKILIRLNQTALLEIQSLPTPLPSEIPALSQVVSENLTWNQHVHALGKFLCFLGYNIWLPYIYLRFIMGYFRLPFWPFAGGFLAVMLAGYYLRFRYPLTLSHDEHRILSEAT